MQEKSEFINFLITYSYLGIIFYYFLLDFISPITEEISFLTIAYLANSNLFNIYTAALITILSLLIRNIILFLISTKPTKLRNKLYNRNPKLGENFRDKISKNLIYTILFFTFIPKIRILVPIVAGVGNVNKKKFFLYESFAQTIFVMAYFLIGTFFHKGFSNYLSQLSNFWQLFLLIFILVASLTGSFILGKNFINKLSK